jgi:hypothetical protein
MDVLTGEFAGTAVESADAQELAQRVAILRRFKTLLTQQRDRFRSYLEMLDKQQEIIETGSADALLAHVDLEEKIVADIYSIQKVIDPLEDMYHVVVSGFKPAQAKAPQADDEVPGLKAALEELKSEAVIRSSRNKELLSHRMAELRQEIKTLRNNPYTGSRRSVYGASLVDIQG